MTQHPPREPVRPAVLSLARRGTALKDAARRLRRWPREGARPSLTAVPRLAFGCSGRDGKTALQPNQKTAVTVGDRRTTDALQRADIFTRHRHRRVIVMAGRYLDREGWTMWRSPMPEE